MHRVLSLVNNILQLNKSYFEILIDLMIVNCISSTNIVCLDVHFRGINFSRH